MLQHMGSQRIRHDWVAEQQQLLPDPKVLAGRYLVILIFASPSAQVSVWHTENPEHMRVYHRMLKCLNISVPRLISYPPATHPSLNCLVFMGFPTFLNFHCSFHLLMLILGYLIFYILPFSYKLRDPASPPPAALLCFVVLLGGIPADN